MKTLTNMMIAAAALVIVAGAARAQVIKAEVPFSFQASGASLPAGGFRLERMPSQNSATIFRLANVDSSRAILVAPHVKSNAPAGDAKLTFECSGDHCALAKMDMGDGLAYWLPTKLVKGEDTRVAVIRVVIAK